MNWQFVSGQKKHTEDGPSLVALIKGIGHGKRPVRAIDVGCGDGIIAHELLKHRKATSVVAIDIQSAAVAATKINLKPFIEEGVAHVTKMSAQGFFRQRKNWHQFDRFVINPPFFVEGSGRANKNSLDQTARHEGGLTLKVWAQGARRLLKSGGELYCVFPTERLSELLAVLSAKGIEPKNLWWLKDDPRQRRVFVRAVRGGRPGLQVIL